MRSALARLRRGSTAGGRRKSVAGRRKSVTAGAGAAGGGRRKSVAAVTATTPKELGESQLTQSGSKVGDLMWARMPPKHPEVYEKTQVLEVVAGTKVKVKLPSLPRFGSPKRESKKEVTA